MNLEHEFLSGEKDGFDALRHSYRAIKDVLENRYYNWVQATCPYFTDHGPNHIAAVVDTASLMMVNARTQPVFTPVELFVLLSAIHWHDIALVYGRANHAENVKLVISDFQRFFPHIDFVRAVKEIAAAHSGRNGLAKPRERDYLSFGNSSYEIHPRQLAAIVRLADEISENRTRISNDLLPSVPEQNRIFWEYANAIASSRPNGERIAISYHIDRRAILQSFACSEFPGRCDEHGKLTLIEYIISRLEKVNNERIYCSQYSSPLVHYVEVEAQITVWDNTDRVREFDGLSFVFRDGGLYRPGEYPNTNIYEPFFTKNDKWKPSNLSTILSQLG